VPAFAGFVHHSLKFGATGDRVYRDHRDATLCRKLVAKRAAVARCTATGWSAASRRNGHERDGGRPKGPERARPGSHRVRVPGCVTLERYEHVLPTGQGVVQNAIGGPPKCSTVKDPERLETLFVAKGRRRCRARATVSTATALGEEEVMGAWLPPDFVGCPL
jgi:hypothetical protein